MATGSDYLLTGFVGRHTRTGIIHHAVEIFHIWGRAWTAAHDYEALKRLSDADLSERGLGRSDLPRAAFHVLTESPKSATR